MSAILAEVFVMTEFEKVLCSTALLLCGASEACAAGASDAQSGSPAADESVRPFHISIPEEALADLRQRVQATRWPDMETVPDRSQGPQLAKLQELVRYWGTDYD